MAAWIHLDPEQNPTQSSKKKRKKDKTSSGSIKPTLVEALDFFVGHFPHSPLSAIFVNHKIVACTRTWYLICFSGTLTFLGKKV